MSKTMFLILGSAGQLARRFQAELTRRGIGFSAPPESECDITSEAQLAAVVDREEPRVILNCAAYNAVDAAEDDPDVAYRINRDAVAAIARTAKSRGAFLVTYSSDYVFDGAKGAPYVESDAPNPQGHYARSKLEGERAVMETLDRYLLFRPSWVFGEGSQNFLYKLDQWAARNPVLKISSDEISVPTYTADMVDLTLAAIDKGLAGLYHMTNSGSCSRYELAEFYLRLTGADNELVPTLMSAFPVRAKRPGNSVMSNARLAAALGRPIPDWRDAVRRFVASRAESQK